MDINQERRCEPRDTLHRPWSIRVTSELIGRRVGRVLDGSSLGLKLSIDGLHPLQPGAHLEIDYPGTQFSYSMDVVWSVQREGQTIIGTRLIEASRPVLMAC